MNNYMLGVDVWEGSLEINEAEFRKGGVEFIFVRLNDMNGGHHKDTGFDKQWAEAKDFIRAPYFVYNPWVSGAVNYSYMRSILPADVTTIALDVEVKYTGYSPTTYAQEVEKCIGSMRAAGYTPIIYTGGGYLNLLSYWLKYVEYWWARYPTFMYPASATYLTWEQLKAKLDAIAWYPAVGGIIPGPCALWQCSGDRYILPGTNRTLDINVFNGTPQDMVKRYKFPDVQVPERLRPSYEVYLPVIIAPATDPIPETTGLKFKVLRQMNVRSGPGVGYADIGDLITGEIVTTSNVAGGNSWIEIAPGKWVAVEYNGVVYLQKI